VPELAPKLKISEEVERQGINAILLGPPGSGKGTQVMQTYSSYGSTAR
jgi:DNA replication protein DnaC